MSATGERTGNPLKPNLGEGGACGRNVSECSFHSAQQAEKDPSSLLLQQELDHAKGKSVDDKDNDKPSGNYKRGSLVNQPKRSSRKQNTIPPSSTPSMSPPAAQAKSTLTFVNPSAVNPRRLRKFPRQTNDTIDTHPHQIQAQTEQLPSHGGWPELLRNTVQTFLDLFRNAFFLPLCFVLALSYLISSFNAPLSEIVATVQSAGTAIGTCFISIWQHAGAWMHSAQNTATPSVYQMVSIGAGLTIGAMNKTAVVVCSNYFGWLMLTNLGHNCPYSTPHQPLNSHVGNTLNHATLGLGQIANSAVELVAYGRQLSYSEIWLRETSYKILESDLVDKRELAENYGVYTDQIAAIGEEITSYVSETDGHLTFQRHNLRLLQGQIEGDEKRSWWLRLFYSKESYIRHQYLDFIQAADDDLHRLFERGQQCFDLIRECQNINGRIQIILQRNRNIVSEELSGRGFLHRWLGRNEDMNRRTVTIENMDEYLRPVLELLGSILDKTRQVRAELSTLKKVLLHGHVGLTQQQLII